jgi:bifunctional DNA-binding transcriptional regulator/antitoxin component of YhaV-PrlF toxin-antitoxin module
MASQVRDLGQITIDQDVREKLGIEPGMIADQRVVNGQWEVVFLPAPHRRSLFGVFRHAAREECVLTSDDVHN